MLFKHFENFSEMLLKAPRRNKHRKLTPGSGSQVRKFTFSR